MSVAELENDTDKTAVQEAAERLADQAAAWGIPRLVATQNQQAMWADARQRTHDAHRAQMKALGVDLPESAAEPMGDIFVVRNIDLSRPGTVRLGKHEITRPETASDREPENPPDSSGSQPVPVAPEPKAGAGWLTTGLLVASMLGGGAGVGYIVHDLLQQPAAVSSDTDTDTITELDFPK